MYLVARFLQLLGLSFLAASIFDDRGLGPNPRLFVAGVAVFVAGWALTKKFR